MPRNKATPRAPRRSDDPEQSKLFIRKAREIGADENESVADQLLGRGSRRCLLSRAPNEL
jgi:hypothetical protein